MLGHGGRRRGHNRQGGGVPVEAGHRGDKARVWQGTVGLKRGGSGGGAGGAAPGRRPVRQESVIY